MKTKLQLKSFAEAINTVARATGGKNIRPILANVLISAEEGEVRLVGTDMEIMVTSRLKADVEDAGKCTISAKLLSELVSTLPIDNDNAHIQFSQEEGEEHVIQLKSGKMKSALQVQGIEEFPPIPVLEGETFPRFEFSSSKLIQALKQVHIAIGSDEGGNPTQKSVCFNFTGGDLLLVTTDSKRLALTKIRNVPYPPEFEKKLLVPSRAIPELLKLLDSSEKINIGLFKDQLIFTTAGFVLLTRLYDGKFPDHQRILPKESSRKLILNHKDFLQALRAVNPIARHGSSMVRFDIGPNETRIWSKSDGEGTSEVFLSSQLQGEPIAIAFNLKFVQDFLGVVETEEVILEMTTHNFPGVFKPNSPDNQFIYVLMPMQY